MFSERITKDKYMLLEALAREAFGPDSSIVLALDRIKDAIYETSSVIENKSEPVKDFMWESIKEESKARESIFTVSADEDKALRHIIATSMAEKANEKYKYKRDSQGRTIATGYSPIGKLDLNKPPKEGSGVDKSER